MGRKRVERIQLLNGCNYTPFAVHPSNWNEAGASANCEWRFTYRFYDPKFKDSFPYGKLVQVKGTNDLKGLMAKRQMMQELLKNERVSLEVKHYNHFTDKYMVDESLTEVEHLYEICPDALLPDALEQAFKKMKAEPETLKSVRLVLNQVIKAIHDLKYSNIKISEVKRVFIKRILNQIGIYKGDKWTANNYNHHRAYLSMLFAELVEWDTIDYNPIEKISKQVVIRKKREALTMDQRIKVYNFLRENNYRFWLLMNIFYLAGCRRNEIMRVQAKDVDMKAQKFKALVKKGRKGLREEYYTITNGAVPYWEMALQGAEPDDYVFSRLLKPGKEAINPRQITRRWRLWIKKKLSVELDIDITADWYSLKHLHSTEIVSKYGLAVSADFNNESKEMIERHYDLLADERKHNIKKTTQIRFLPTGN